MQITLLFPLFVSIIFKLLILSYLIFGFHFLMVVTMHLGFQSCILLFCIYMLNMLMDHTTFVTTLAVRFAENHVTPNKIAAHSSAQRCHFSNRIHFAYLLR